MSVKCIFQYAPSFGSDTIREADLSSRFFRREASFGDTFPSTIAEILSNASAVFSNFEKVFNRRLNHNQYTLSNPSAFGRCYMEVAFSTVARSSARVFRFFKALSFALNMAYPAAVSARMKTMVSEID